LPQFYSFFLFLISDWQNFLSARNSMKSTFLERSFLSRMVSFPNIANRSGIVCLLLALQWGGTEHPWNSSVIIGLFIGFGLMIIIFVIVQIKRGDNATLPPSILRQRTVASAALFQLFLGAGLFILIYYSNFLPCVLWI